MTQAAGRVLQQSGSGQARPGRQMAICEAMERNSPCPSYYVGWQVVLHILTLLESLGLALTRKAPMVADGF